MSSKQILSIGLMLFALFLGAGNMIFPPALGQESGTNIWFAIIGFLVTGVGLPLLAITAVAINDGNFEKVGARVHPKFGSLFTIILYLSIGPLFAIPRTGTVAFEIGATPFLSEKYQTHGISLFLFTFIFFTITYLLAKNPSKLVDRIGKVLTPVLLFSIAAIVIKAIIEPMGPISSPSESYASNPFFTGFINGYLTLDALGALAFGIVVVNAIRDLGVTNKKKIAIGTIQSGMIAAIGLALVYLALAYLGATSTSVVGTVANGGEILSKSANYYYHVLGTVMLGTAISLACLTTSVGLVSSCSEYFVKLFPTISYRTFTLILSIVSLLIANVGLTQLIKFSLPALMMIYPIAIILIFLSFLDFLFSVSRSVYIGGVLGTGIISVLDGFVFGGVVNPHVKEVLSAILPLYSKGVGWIFPAIIGLVIGYIISLKQPSDKKQWKKAS